VVKLNKEHYTEHKISNNLLKRNPTEKQAVCRRLIIRMVKNRRVGGHCKASSKLNLCRDMKM